MKILSGPNYILQAIPLLMHKQLRTFVIAPFLINLVLFTIMFYFGYKYFSEFSAWATAQLPVWLDWLSWILWVLFVVLFALFMMVSFTMVGNIIAAPFNSFLSERVQILKKQTLLENKRSRFWIVKDILSSIKRQLKVLLYYIPRILILLIISFIPLLQLVAVPLWFIFNSWMMSLQYFDYSFENNQKSFQQMKVNLSAQKLSVLSFGASILLLTIVPFINFLAMPVGVIAATLFYCDKFSETNT